MLRAARASPPARRAIVLDELVGELGSELGAPLRTTTARSSLVSGSSS